MRLSLLVFLLTSSLLNGEYCKSGPLMTSPTFISQVALYGNSMDINDWANCSTNVIPGTQTNSAPQKADLTIGGGGYMFQVVTCSLEQNQNVSYTAWVDWNQNQIYESNEVLANFGLLSAFTLFFPMRDDAKIGATKMRVQAQANTPFPLDPCAQFNYGVSKDFDLVISAPTPVKYCLSGPTAQATAALGPFRLGGETHNLTESSIICNVSGVFNQTYRTTDVMIGAYYPVSIDVDDSCNHSQPSTFTAMWIDLNQNLVYEANELIFNTSGKDWNPTGVTYIPETLNPYYCGYGTFKTQIRIPETAKPGLTGVRVQTQVGGQYPLDPCAQFLDGSTKEFTVNIKPFGGYCVSGPTQTLGASFLYVKLHGETQTINDNEIYCPQFLGPQDLTWRVMDVKAGKNYTIQYQLTNCMSGGGGPSAIWIDYNQNMIFDSNELVFNSSGSNINASISIPSTAPTHGTTRLRIQVQGDWPSGSLNPCANFNTGATKDYTIQFKESKDNGNSGSRSSELIGSWLVIGVAVCVGLLIP